jgi:Ca2+-binding EF-hand superfamily protein
MKLASIVFSIFFLQLTYAQPPAEGGQNSSSRYGGGIGPYDSNNDQLVSRAEHAEHFAELDTNGDGRLVEGEVTVGQVMRYDRNKDLVCELYEWTDSFDKIDTNHDEFITLTEYQVMRDTSREDFLNLFDDYVE